MKLVIAIIQPHKLEAVKRELEAVEVNLMTVTNVVGQGTAKRRHGNLPRRQGSRRPAQ